MPNHSSLARLRIVNIGCIGANGVTIDMADIVCLVGANNCGKSTVLRAYEAAVTNAALRAEDIHSGAAGAPASVEIWVRVPAGTPNIDAKWIDGEGLVRSQWTWSQAGGGPVRTTWDPTAGAYAENGKA